MKEKIDLMVKGGTFITMDPQRRVVSDGAVAVDGNLIKAVGKRTDIAKKFSADETVDASGKVVIPGIVNAHTHLFQNLLKGLGDDLPLVAWYKKSVASNAPRLRPEDCHAAAMLGCAEAIRSGVTCVNDFMYAHPRPKLSDPVIKAFKEAGVRGMLSRGIVTAGKENGVPESMIQDLGVAIRDCERLIKEYHGSEGGRITVAVAPGSAWYTTRETFTESKRLASKHKVWLSSHSSESPDVLRMVKEKYGMREVEFEESIGFLGPNLQLVHAVWLTDEDIALIRKRGTQVVHCPVANMYLGDGIAPVVKLLRAGVTVSLGTDGAASNNNQDMISLLKHAALLQKVSALDPTAITAEQVLEMATIGGAKAVGLGDKIGSLEAGKKADLAVLDFDKPNTQPAHNPVSCLVYCATQENVDTVVIDGKVAMERREIKTFDEDEAMAAAREARDWLVGGK